MKKKVAQNNDDKVFLISPQKHMLWVLDGIASVKKFEGMSIAYDFEEKLDKYLYFWV